MAHSPGNPFTIPPPLPLGVDYGLSPHGLVLPEFPLMEDTLLLNGGMDHSQAVYENANFGRGMGVGMAPMNISTEAMPTMQGAQSLSSMSDSNNELNNDGQENQQEDFTVSIDEEGAVMNLKKLNISEDNAGSRMSQGANLDTSSSSIPYAGYVVDSRQCESNGNGNIRIIVPAPMQDATANPLALGHNQTEVKANNNQHNSARKMSAPSHRGSLPVEMNATPPSYEMAVELTSNSAPPTPQPQLDDSLSNVIEPIDKPSKRKSTSSRDSRESYHQARGSIHSVEAMKEAKRSGSIEEEEDMSTTPDSSLQSPQSPTSPQSDLAIPDTKLHISFSDDENTENSEDSGVPRPPRALESMTFEEIESL
eukprot:XP_011674734.1 PREDICTED: uncharacterized protein LOC105443366 [Strongylocentrotus purpuratus]